MKYLNGLMDFIKEHEGMISVALAWFAKDCKAAWQWLATTQGVGGIKRYIATGSYSKDTSAPPLVTTEIKSPQPVSEVQQTVVTK